MHAAVRAAMLAALAVPVATGLAGAAPSPAAEPAPPGAAPAVATAAARHPAQAFRSTRTYAAVAAPVRLRIPALRLSAAPLQHLGRGPDGTVAVPDRADVAGWYAAGPRPGQAGPAVLLGHVDSEEGPGVFLHLSRLRPGAAVHVDRADGTTVTFRVTGVRQVPKGRFPTDLVYAPTLLPALRLVTCGGAFDRTRGSYRDNVIVLADRA
ncbi:class F sortase [Spirilliplanes yamanashiensis]|uniref:Sortase family protein n=1 Tax=Spirilliplanes yamanashiensis TaxID=42233 RepID=A0A8J3Y7M6_9ACTN|nr:class F sortase [Spirilliplanes yamanashiensis]MDP9817330.1 hypothetical protein [Spirilliplanes yamanashiensis]GIJ03019.1 hypothetical protein Sya03_23710 [Spirilliplanes yamanashiensis]